MVLIIVLLLAVNALYVAGEYAVVSVGRVRAGRLARERRTGARHLLAVKTDPECLDRTLTACQIGISASSMILGAYSQMVMVPVLEPLLLIWPGLGLLTARSTAVVLTLLFITALQVVLGEQLPKSLAVRHPSRWSLITILPLSLSRATFSILITLLGRSAELLLKVLRIHSAPSRPALHTPEEIAALIGESARGGGLQPALVERLHNALRLAGRTARDIMVPRMRVTAVPLDVSIPELQKVIRESGHTRLPVYRDTQDVYIGVVHARDLLLQRLSPAPDPIPSMLRPLPAVPGERRAPALLESMRLAHATLAVVLDEHGGTAGIVTLEDIMEEVLGEVEDEFDTLGPALGLLPDGRFRIRGEETVAWVRSHLGLPLKAAAVRTMGGLVMQALGRLPQPGDRLRIGSIRLQVERVKGRRVESLLVERVGDENASEGKP